MCKIIGFCQKGLKKDSKRTQKGLKKDFFFVRDLASYSSASGTLAANMELVGLTSGVLFPKHHFMGL